METHGRTGRRRKRKKNGSYNKVYGSAIHEPDYIALFKWAKQNGISFGKLHPANFLKTGRGLMSSKKLKSGDLVISVPEKMLITAKSAERSEIGQELVKLQLNSNSVLSARQLLCVFILYEKCRGSKSFWHPYISTLPRCFNMPAYFNKEEIHALSSNLQQQCAAQIITVQESYDQLKRFLEKHMSVLNKKFVELFTFDEFKWAWFVINTRSVYKANNLHTFPAGTASLQTDEAYALAPVLDLLNHTDTAEVQAGFNQESCCYEIYTLTEYNKGLQVFINYGPHDNTRLLMEYGFILPKNLHNTVTFSQDLVYSIVLPEIGGISQRKKEVISLNQLDKDLCCSEENGLSWSALVLLRILAMDEDSFKKDWQRVLTGDCLSEDVELRVLQWSQCLIQGVLKSYEEAENASVIYLAIHDNPSMNLQLVLQLRYQEKQILRNALETVNLP